MAIERDMVLSFKGDPSSAIRALNQVQGKMTEVHKSTTMLNEAWKSMGTLAAGFIAWKTVEMVGKFEDGIRRVGINANLSASQMLQLKDGILTNSVATGASSDEMLALSKSFLDVNKNSDFYMRNLKYISALQVASGASGAELGKALGELQMEGKLTDTQFQTMTATMLKFSQGKFSKMSFAEMVPDTKKMMEAVKLTYGPNASTKQIQDFITTSLFTGNPQALAKAMVRMRANPIVQRQLRAIGADVNKDSLFDILAKGKAAGLSVAGIAQLLGVKGVAGLERLINDTKEWEEALKQTGGTAQDVYGKANQMSQGFGGSMNRLHAVFLRIADKSFAPVIDELAKSLANIDPKTWDNIAASFKLVGDSLVLSAKGWGAIIETARNLWLAAHGEGNLKESAKAMLQGLPSGATSMGTGGQEWEARHPDQQAPPWWLPFAPMSDTGTTPTKGGTAPAPTKPMVVNINWTNDINWMGGSGSEKGKKQFNVIEAGR